MGELRYLPGFEPRNEGTGREHTLPSVADDSSAPSDGGEQAAGESTPSWAVPGLDLGGPRPIEDPTAGHPSRARLRAEHVSLAAIGSHDMSEAELRTRLAARGLEQADIDAEVQRVVGVGLVDDVALAVRLVQTLRERKGLGDAAIRPALRSRRIPQAVIDEVLLQHAVDETSVRDRLQDVADDRARRLVGLPPEVATRRLAAFLARKGYSGSDVRAATRLALDRAHGSA